MARGVTLYRGKPFVFTRGDFLGSTKVFVGGKPAQID